MHMMGHKVGDKDSVTGNRVKLMTVIWVRDSLAIIIAAPQPLYLPIIVLCDKLSALSFEKPLPFS